MAKRENEIEYRKSFITAHNAVMDLYRKSIWLLIIPIPFVLPCYVLWRKRKYSKTLRSISETGGQKT